MVNLQKTMDKWRQRGYTQGLMETARQFNNGEIGFEDLKQVDIPDVFKKPVEMFLGQEGLKEFEKQYKPKSGEYWWDNLNILNRIVNYKNGIFDAYWFNNYTDEWRKGKDMGKGGVPLTIKATTNEIEQELKRIFERLGYVGKTVKEVDRGEEFDITGEGLFIYNSEFDWCFMDGAMVYCEGKWAEIVEEKDIDDIYSPLRVKRKERYKVKKEDNKKVAVYAPEPWMKEKVAKVWGIEDDFIYHKYCGDYIHIVDDGKNNRIVGFNLAEAATEAGYVVITFQDFCNQHGISDKPDYVWIKTKEGWQITGDVKYGLNNGELWVDTSLNEYGVTFHFKPATGKEYQKQESKKEPELKLNKEWEKFAQELEDEGIAEKNAVLEGIEYMQEAIYDRVLEYYKGGIKNFAYGWEISCKVTIDDIKQGKIKPPKQ